LSHAENTLITLESSCCLVRGARATSVSFNCEPSSEQLQKINQTLIVVIIKSR